MDRFPTDAPENAVFVPPFEPEMLKAWKDWKDFANTTVRLPILAQCDCCTTSSIQFIRSLTETAELAGS